MASMAESKSRIRSRPTQSSHQNRPVFRVLEPDGELEQADDFHDVGSAVAAGEEFLADLEAGVFVKGEVVGQVVTVEHDLAGTANQEVDLAVTGGFNGGDRIDLAVFAGPLAVFVASQKRDAGATAECGEGNEEEQGAQDGWVFSRVVRPDHPENQKPSLGKRQS